MKSTKCAECGFVGWADVENCKACGAHLGQQSHNLPHPTPLPATSYAQWDETERPKEGLAIFALILGIVGFFTVGLLGVGAVTGVIVGWIAMRRAKREPWRYGGYGMALTGFVLSIVMLGLYVPIMAAIAIPNLLAARRAANEGSAMATMRLISSAEISYQSTFGKFATLDELAAQNLIDQKLAAGTKNGYSFRIEMTTNEENLEGYAVTGVPLTYPSSGARSFYVDETQVLRVADNRGGPASKMDQPLDSDDYDYRSNRPTRRADYRPQTVY